MNIERTYTKKVELAVRAWITGKKDKITVKFNEVTIRETTGKINSTSMQEYLISEVLREYSSYVYLHPEFALKKPTLIYSFIGGNTLVGVFQETETK